MVPQDLEGWTPEDNPKAEHEKHCPNCPLIRLKINAASAITLREQIRLDTAIEFHRKKLLCKREWSKVRALHEDERDRLKELIAKAEKHRAAQLVNESETMLWTGHGNRFLKLLFVIRRRFFLRFRHLGFCFLIFLVRFFFFKIY